MADETIVTTGTPEGDKSKEGAVAPVIDPAKEPTPPVKDDKIDKTTETKTIEYVDFKLPEGFETDVETTTSFKALAKEYKLTQEQAQKLVDMQAALSSKQTKMSTDQWTTVQNGWKDAAKADKDYGGANFEANIGVAKKALDKWGSPALKEAIELTGMGNHPEFIRLLVNVGKATLTEDNKTMDKSKETTPNRDIAKTLFPNLA